MKQANVSAPLAALDDSPSHALAAFGLSDGRRPGEDDGTRFREASAIRPGEGDGASPLDELRRTYQIQEEWSQRWRIESRVFSPELEFGKLRFSL